MVFPTVCRFAPKERTGNRPAIKIDDKIPHKNNTILPCPGHCFYENFARVNFPSVKAHMKT
jgi:hypothetical protein